MLVKREALKASLDRVRPAIATGDKAHEPLKHVWWDAGYLYGFNGGLGIRTIWEMGLPPAGVLATVRNGVVGSTAAEELDIAVEGDQMTVKVGRSKTKLATLPPSSFPWPPEYSADIGGAQCSIDLNKDVAMAIRHAGAIRAKNPHRVEHHGVSLFPFADFISLYSTDAQTLAEVRLKGRYSKDLTKMVLPHDFVRQIMTLDLPSKVHFMPSAIIAEATGVRVCANLLDNSEVWDLPKLMDESIPSEDPTIIPKGWDEAIRRARVLTKGDDDPFLTLSVSPKAKELIIEGKLRYGLLEERFALTGPLTEAKVAVGLGYLETIGREAREFNIVTDTSLVLVGKNAETFVIGSHEAKTEE